MIALRPAGLLAELKAFECGRPCDSPGCAVSTNPSVKDKQRDRASVPDLRSSSSSPAPPTTLARGPPQSRPDLTSSVAPRGAGAGVRLVTSVVPRKARINGAPECSNAESSSARTRFGYMPAVRLPSQGGRAASAYPQLRHPPAGGRPTTEMPLQGSSWQDPARSRSPRG
jgi:hypothetical protein